MKIIRIILLLGLSLESCLTLDFSQFYLPQCCYSPQAGIPAASTIENVEAVAPFRHDIRARKAEPNQVIKLKKDNKNATDSVEETEAQATSIHATETKAEKREVTNQESARDKQTMATRLYRYIIPMDKKEVTRLQLLARSAEQTGTKDDATETDDKDTDTEDPSQTTTMSPLLRERGNKMRKSIEKDLAELKLKQQSLFSSAQIETDLLPEKALPQIQHKNKTQVERTPSLESLLFSQNTTMGSLVKHKRNTEHYPTTTTATRQSKNKRYQKSTQNHLNKLGINYKMPSSWITNLRRALYQSIDSMLHHTYMQSKSRNKIPHNHKQSSNSEEEAYEAKSSDNLSNRRRPKQHPQDSSIDSQEAAHNQRISLLWPQLREANLTLIEPLTRSETMLPDNIYLPTGTGPVASGVVVNTVNGIQLRMASELYFQQDQPNPEQQQHLTQGHRQGQQGYGHGQGQNGCNCHLIQNGDILMAYWSVSRIMNENGNPSLQYLVYPVPYNVPTPPRVENFNTQVFRPSSSFHQNQHQSQPTHKHRPNRKHQHQQQHVQQSDSQHQQVNFHPFQHPDRDPNQINHHEHPELPPPYLQETPFNLIPAQPSPMAFPPNYETIFKNLQQFNQLPPGPGPINLPRPGPADDRTDFRGVVVQTENGYTPEFVELYKQAVANHLNQKDHQQLLQQQFIDPNPTQPQVLHGVIGGGGHHPGQRFNNNVPPAHIQLFDGKQPSVQPTSRNPNFPKSIQEIITPFTGEVVSTISTAGPGPGSLIVHPNPTIPGIIPVGLGSPPQQFPGLNFDPNFQQHPLHIPPTHNQNQQHHTHKQNSNENAPHDKNFNVNNYYSFDGGVKGQHYFRPDAGIEEELYHHLQQPGYSRPPNYPNDNDHNYPIHPHPPPSLNSNNNHHHNNRPYYPGPNNNNNNKPRPNRPSSNSDEEEIRYHRSQQIPNRHTHRTETYTRPSGQKRFNQDGSYIINF